MPGITLVGEVRLPQYQDTSTVKCTFAENLIFFCQIENAFVHDIVVKGCIKYTKDSLPRIGYQDSVPRIAWSIGGVQVYLCYQDTSTTINIKPIRSHAGSSSLNNCANLHAAGMTMVTVKPLPVQIRRESSYLPTHTPPMPPSRWLRWLRGGGSCPSLSHVRLRETTFWCCTAF